MNVGCGYADDTSAGSHMSEESLHYCSDPNIKYSSDQQRERGLAVDQELAQPSEAGCHGSSCLAALPYVHMNNLRLIPLAHALLYGMLKDFLHYLLGTKTRDALISAEAKRHIIKRAAAVGKTMDLNRPYRDVIKERGTGHGSVLACHTHVQYIKSVHIHTVHRQHN